MLIIAVLKSLSYDLAKLIFLGNGTVGMLASGGSILSCLLVVVFLCWELDLWSYGVCSVSPCSYLSVCSVLWLLLPHSYRS